MLKSAHTFFIGFLSLIFLSSCSVPVAQSEPNDSGSGPPEDIVSDVLRAQGEFAFETYVSVDLDIAIGLVRSQTDPAAGESLDAADFTIISTVYDEKGTPLFRAMADEAGRLEGSFGVSTSVESVDLVIEGPGLDLRRFVIENITDYERISRTIYLETDGMAISASALTDTDGDGVPDIYDADSNDANVAFTRYFPAEDEGVSAGTMFTVAYEDNFPSLGDGDYNDFVVNYNLEGTFGRNGTIVQLSGTAVAREKIAGYDHEFGLMLRIPGFSGFLGTELNGVDQIVDRPVGNEIRIPLFASTQEATAGGGAATATFTVFFDASASSATQADLPAAPFDPYLYIKNTEYDVHLIGELPLPGSNIDWDEDFRDADGFPRALLVPGYFSPPKERTSIVDAYPEFQRWVDSEGAANRNWYSFPEADMVIDLPALQ